jgi:uncharacterized protein (UPF0335 family)
MPFPNSPQKTSKIKVFCLKIMSRFSTEHKTFRKHTNASKLVEAMEKVWAELKKIEAHAEEIHSEAKAATFSSEIV